MWKWKVHEEPIEDDIHMYRFKKSDGGIMFIGVNDTKKTYSTDYYANVGICNMDEPVKSTLKTIKEIYRRCTALDYKYVERLREIKKI